MAEVKAKKKAYSYSFVEYPKKVDGPGGKRVTVNSKAEEDALGAAKPGKPSTAKPGKPSTAKPGKPSTAKPGKPSAP